MPTRESRSIDASQGPGDAGSQGGPDSRELRGRLWGAGGIAGGRRYNDEIKKITTQRRYAFNNPVRFVATRLRRSPPSIGILPNRHSS